MATAATIGVAAYPTPDDVLNAMLRTLKFGYQRVGIAVNVLPGSEHYERAKMLAQRASIALANGKIARQDFSPLTATGDALRAICGVFGVSERAANGAAGYVTIACTGTITIPSGFRGTAPNGKKYDTVSSSVGITTGAKVQLRAVATGTATDQIVGTQITWDSAAVGGLKQTAVVAAGGFTGGSAADTDETLRRRLIDAISFPSAGGNIAFVKQTAEESTSAVKTAYVYAAVQGPGSLDVAVISDEADGTLSDANVATVQSAVVGNLPGGVIAVNATTITPQYVDVILSATLPAAKNAGGTGGGWLDASPWPSGAFTAGADDGHVTGYVSATGVATIRISTAPVVGQRIGIWDPIGGDKLDGEMNEYTITVVGGISGARTIKVDGGFKVDPTGAYVSTGAAQLAAYASAYKTQMQALGPGEKTDDVDILQRGRRQLGVDVADPSDLTTAMLSAVQTAYSEVSNLAYLGRFATGTTTTKTTPDIPSTTALPPKRFTLEHFALRKA